MIGKIDKVEKKDGDNWTKWTAHIGDKFASTFNSELAAALQVGKTVELVTEKSGKYTNIIEVKEPTTKGMKKAVSEKVEAKQETDAKTKDIHRQVALKCAVKAISHIEEKITSDGTLRLAEKFETWLNR